MSIFRITAKIALLLTVFVIAGGQQFKPKDPNFDVDRDPYVPTPQRVVDAMLAMADVGPDDVVYDLGSGDGRLVITAVNDFGAKRGVGIDIDPQRIKESRANAKEAGVTDKVEFIQGSFYDVNFSEATVLSLYLLPDTLAKLKARFINQLDAGTPIVTHDFRIEGWKPVAQKQVSTPRDAVSSGTIYLWEVPAE